ncbi:hypothetical protein [Kutzneria chonburiensis]|uniref:Uncharacterized protein n=1 Tax=Kutzneria chonburiensis TaxID=1483604 RepID=A0ABV6MN17_9PSEU
MKRLAAAIFGTSALLVAILLSPVHGASTPDAAQSDNGPSYSTNATATEYGLL